MQHSEFQPTPKQWELIKQIWTKIDYAKLNPIQKANFLLAFEVNNGFGHPREFDQIIRDFQTKKIETLPKEVIEYFKGMESQVARLL
jgi:hypothetical protein